MSDGSLGMWTSVKCFSQKASCCSSYFDSNKKSFGFILLPDLLPRLFISVPLTTPPHQNSLNTLFV